MSRFWSVAVFWKEHKNPRQQRCWIKGAQHWQGHEKPCTIVPNQPDQKSSQPLWGAHWVCSCRQSHTFQGTQSVKVLGICLKKLQEHKKTKTKWVVVLNSVSPLPGIGIAILEQKTESSIYTCTNMPSISSQSQIRHVNSPGVGQVNPCTPTWTQHRPIFSCEHWALWEIRLCLN